MELKDNQAVNYSEINVDDKGNLKNKKVILKYSEIRKLLGIDLKESLSLYTEGLRVSLSWANKSTKFESIDSHVHPNSWYSAVYYVTDNTSQTHFKTPLSQSLTGVYIQSDSMLNREEWIYGGPAGSMILFPSWLEHRTKPFDGDGERVTISFNIMPRGLTSPYYLSGNVY